MSEAPNVRLISIDLAQEYLEAVLKQLEADQEFWITRNDKPIVRLSPLTASERKAFAEEAALSEPPESR